MCGRVDQNDISRMLSDRRWADEVINRSQAEPLYNVAPSTRRPVMRRVGATLLVEDMHWGYQAPWAVGKVSVAINARLEKLTDRYWRWLLKSGRIIVPANGWYEWTGKPGSKQPWHLHRADGGLLYMAALAYLAYLGEPGESPAANGFAIVTGAAGGGLADIHDRRPVVLSAADAATWLDADTPPELAEQLARELALGSEAFAWHRVVAAVGNVRNQGAELAVPLVD